VADPSQQNSLLMRDIVKDPSLLANKRKELDTLRADDNKEWAQNKEFYKGNQWVMWNNVSNSIETLGVAETDRPRYKVRLVNNVYQTNTNQLVAQMTKTRPVIHAVPGSGADSDVKAAQFAERLYEVKWDDLSLRSKLQSALVNAQISQGYWLITWDGLAGKAMKVMLDPNGQPIWDQELAGIFKEELRDAAKQAGQDPQQIIAQYEKVVYLGDMRVDVLDGPNVWLDPVPNNWEDCSYVIIKIPMTVDEIEARYGKVVTPNASSGDRTPALMYSTKNEANNRPANVRETFHIYHKPTPAMPRGRWACWIESPDMFLAESGWELPFSTLPIIKFSGIERPGSVYDEARGTGGRPMQKELNDIISGIAMHRRITMKPQMIAPVGSMRQRLTDEPGAVFEFNPVAGMTPEWRQTPPLPAYVFETLQDVQRRLDRHYNIMPTERSSLPARTDSGHMVELVMEAVADQLSPEIQRMEISLAKTGDIMAAYAQKYYQEERMLRIKGPGGSVSVKKFMNTDLDGSYSFEAEAGTGLPRTREGQIQQIKEMVEMGVLDPHEAIQYLPIAGLKGVQSRIASDEDFASRKIDKLIKGEPLNPAAMQQAIMAVQQTGQNPDTGDFFSSPEEAMAYVQSAALKPYLFENLQLSMHVVAEAMKAPEFEKYPPEVQSRFEDHFSQLRQTMFSIPQIDPNGVRVTLGLNGTVGPTAAAEILRKKGLYDITPDTMMEEPLETSVYDSVDKADADDAGNDPLTQLDQMLTIQAAQSSSQLKDAKTAQALAHAQGQAEQSAQQKAAEADRQAQLHEQAMTHAEQLHQQKLKQAEEAHQKQLKEKPSGPAK
jgi:hypothetical protein